MRPFNLLRACFWLLAIVMILQMVSTVLAGLLCWWTNFYSVREVGACLPIDNVIREVWGEILTAVLALLLAARSGGRDPPDQDRHDDQVQHRQPTERPDNEP